MSYVDEDDEAPARVQDLRPKDLVMFSPAAREAITKVSYLNKQSSKQVASNIIKFNLLLLLRVIITI